LTCLAYHHGSSVISSAQVLGGGGGSSVTSPFLYLTTYSPIAGYSSGRGGRSPSTRLRFSSVGSSSHSIVNLIVNPIA